ncbi:MAG: hypothetical protein NTX15_08070 [Candidatus Kapabacteria bacterium]|nr:hypothetical protein [Candidatus Kapabacteria bacterium]
MTHRLVLMLSAFLMMFAIFGLVMWIGANAGDNDDAAFGNMILCLLMTASSITALVIGLRMRTGATSRIEGAIAMLTGSIGYIEATTFAAEMKISLDDARDVLDKRSRIHNWRRVELEQYNARYYPS